MEDLKENTQKKNMKKLVLCTALGMFCYCSNNVTMGMEKTGSIESNLNNNSGNMQQTNEPQISPKENEKVRTDTKTKEEDKKDKIKGLKEKGQDGECCHCCCCHYKEKEKEEQQKQEYNPQEEPNMFDATEEIE